MIYNLILNSATYLSANSSTDMGQRVYGVDWSFLPENKKFKVSFNFLCKSSSISPYTFGNLYFVGANFGPMALVWEGSTNIQSKNSFILGTLKTITGDPMIHTDTALYAGYLDNPPITLLTRPNNNLLEVFVWKNTAFTGSALPTDYILRLSFEEIHE